MMKANKAIKYKWMSSRINLAIFILAMAVNVAVVSIPFGYSRSLEPAAGRISGNVDMMAAIWIFILGLVSFRPAFKFMLANGLTRKRFFLTDIPANMITAASWTAVTLVCGMVLKLFTNCFLINEVIYKRTDVLSDSIWLFSGYLMLIVLGWFISLLYYRCDRIMKLVVTLAPVLLLILLWYVDSTTGAGIYKAIGQFLASAMGLSSATPNPYVGSLSMIAFTVVLCGLIYLLLKKAEIKE